MNATTAVVLIACFGLLTADPSPECYDMGSCCDVTGFHDKNLLLKCMKKLGFTSRPPNQDQIKCIAQCLGNEEGYMDNKGVVDKEHFRSYLKKSLVSLSWLSPTELNGIMDICLDQAESGQIEPNKCNDFSITVGHCLMPKIQKLCPTGEEQNAENCAALKTYIREENEFPPAQLQCW